MSKCSVEDYVTDEFFAFMASVKVKPEDQGERSLAEIEGGFEETEAALHRIARAHCIDGRITEANFIEAHDEQAKKLADFQCARESAESRLAKRTNALRPGSREDIEAWWGEASPEDRRVALAKAIEKVVVDPAKVRGGDRFDTGRLQIFWCWDVYVQAYVEGTLSVPDDAEVMFTDEGGNQYDVTVTA